MTTVTCPTCGFSWEEDLNWHREHDSIHTVHPGLRPRTGAEIFRFRCPQDGTWVTVGADQGQADNSGGAGDPGHEG